MNDRLQNSRASLNK